MILPEKPAYELPTGWDAQGSKTGHAYGHAYGIYEKSEEYEESPSAYGQATVKITASPGRPAQHKKKVGETAKLRARRDR